MKALLKKRVGAYVMKSPFWTSMYVPGRFASWPMSIVEFFTDRLVITILGKKFEIRYKEIDGIEKRVFSIQIHHHNANVDEYVYLSGTGTGHFFIQEN